LAGPERGLSSAQLLKPHLVPRYLRSDDRRPLALRLGSCQPSRVRARIDLAAYLGPLNPDYPREPLAWRQVSNIA